MIMVEFLCKFLDTLIIRSKIIILYNYDLNICNFLFLIYQSGRIFNQINSRGTLALLLLFKLAGVFGKFSVILEELKRESLAERRDP